MGKDKLYQYKSIPIIINYNINFIEIIIIVLDHYTNENEIHNNNEEDNSSNDNDIKIIYKYINIFNELREN